MGRKGRVKDSQINGDHLVHFEFFQKKKMSGRFPTYTPPYMKRSKMLYPGRSRVNRGGVRFQTVTGTNERRSQRLARADKLAAVGGRPLPLVPVAARAMERDPEGDIQAELRHGERAQTSEEQLRSSLRMEQMMENMMAKKANGTPTNGAPGDASREDHRFSPNPLYDLNHEAMTNLFAHAFAHGPDQSLKNGKPKEVHNDAAGTPIGGYPNPFFLGTKSGISLSSLARANYPITTRSGDFIWDEPDAKGQKDIQWANPKTGYKYWAPPPPHGQSEMPHPYADVLKYAPLLATAAFHEIFRPVEHSGSRSLRHH